MEPDDDPHVAVELAHARRRHCHDVWGEIAVARSGEDLATSAEAGLQQSGIDADVDHDDVGVVGQCRFELVEVGR